MHTQTTSSKAIDRSLSAETGQALSTQHVLKKDFDFFNQYLSRLPREICADLYLFVPKKVKELLQIQQEKTQNKPFYWYGFFFRIENRSSFTLNKFKLSVAGEACWARKMVKKTELARLVVMEGEDNQNKAELLLKGNPDLAYHLIADPMKHAKDAAGRVFLEPISTYALAFWSGDTRFCLMMKKYMDNKTKQIVLAECERIQQQGVLFRMDGEVSRSQHFDLKPLIQAYKNYRAAEVRYFDTHHPQRPSELMMHQFWLTIGKEQAKLPTHLLQEFASKQSFGTNIMTDITYAERLTQPRLERTVTLTLKTNSNISLIIEDRVNPELGASFTVFKELNPLDSDKDICCWDTSIEEETPSISNKARLNPRHWRQDVESDYEAMLTIQIQRFERDIIQIFDSLKSDQHSSKPFLCCFR